MDAHLCLPSSKRVNHLPLTSGPRARPIYCHSIRSEAPSLFSPLPPPTFTHTHTHTRAHLLQIVELINVFAKAAALTKASTACLPTPEIAHRCMKIALRNESSVLVSKYSIPYSGDAPFKDTVGAGGRGGQGGIDVQAHPGLTTACMHGGWRWHQRVGEGHPVCIADTVHHVWMWPLFTARRTLGSAHYGRPDELGVLNAASHSTTCRPALLARSGSRV